MCDEHRWTDPRCPASIPAAGPGGSARQEPSRPGCSPVPGQRELGPPWYLPPSTPTPRKEQGPSCLLCAPTQAPGKCPLLCREGQEARMAGGFPRGKQVFGWGSPVTRSPALSPRLPSGSSLRNRKMSADGRVFWKQTVLFRPVPGDVSSFPHSRLDVRRGLRESVSPVEVVLRMSLPGCPSGLSPYLSLGGRQGTSPHSKPGPCFPRGLQCSVPEHVLGCGRGCGGPCSWNPLGLTSPVERQVGDRARAGLWTPLHGRPRFCIWGCPPQGC